MKVYQVIKTDRHLSKDSEVLCGTFATRYLALRAILRNHELKDIDVIPYERCLELTKGQRRSEVVRIVKQILTDSNQTQGFPVNYIIRDIEVNIWLK